MPEQVPAKKVFKSNNPFDIFINGARKGFAVGVNNLLPNVLMAFVITHMLTLVGIMGWLGDNAGFVMGIFGLPGEALAALLGTWLSCSAGAGIAFSLLTAGHLTTAHVTIMFAAFFLMASQIQYMGRLLGVADCPKRYWPLLMLTSILNSCISMWIMRFFV